LDVLKIQEVFVSVCSGAVALDGLIEPGDMILVVCVYLCIVEQWHWMVVLNQVT